MAINFLRYIKLQLQNGAILDSDQHNIEFEVNRSTTSNGNIATLDIKYINNATFNLFKQDEELQIIAGYKKGVIGLLFNGTIDKIEKKIDSVTIICTEDNEKIHNTVVNESFTPNTKVSTAVKQIVEKNGFKVGLIEIPNDYQYYRGKYFTENVKDSLDKLASEVGCQFYIKKGLVYFHPPKRDFGTNIINANNGLLEFNKKEDGYIMITKLNHLLDENTKVQVEFNKNEKVIGIIQSVSHYSNDFVTECEVDIDE